MLTAADRMLDGNGAAVRIKELASELGITEPANFTREFKRVFGLTPSWVTRHKSFFSKNVAR